MNQPNSHIIRKNAENKALSYLKNLEWEIIYNNYKIKYWQTDILSIKNKTLVAFEVKTRKYNHSFYYSISQKQQRIANSSLFFLSKNQLYSNFTLRFNALLIKNNKINHIGNAWSHHEQY